MEDLVWYIIIIIVMLLTVLSLLLINCYYITEIKILTHLYENEMWTEIISFLTK